MVGRVRCIEGGRVGKVEWLGRGQGERVGEHVELFGQTLRPDAFATLLVQQSALHLGAWMAIGRNGWVGQICVRL